MRKFLALGAAALALAACSGSDEKAGNKDGKPVDVATAQKSIDAIHIKPGLWETKIAFKSIDAKAMPEAAKQQMIAAMGNGITVKSCVSKEQAEKPGAAFFGSPNSSNCAVQNVEVSGDTMNVAMTCKPGGNTVIESSMAGRFDAENYSMELKQKTSGTPMGDLLTTGKIDGKRLGDCPA